MPIYVFPVILLAALQNEMFQQTKIFNIVTNGQSS